MEAVIIEIKNEADSKFWLKLAKKTGARAKSINTEDLEDSNLASLIEKGMKTKSVSRESVISNLSKVGIVNLFPSSLRFVMIELRSFH